MITILLLNYCNIFLSFFNGMENMKTDKASSTALTVAQGILFRANKPEAAKLVTDEVRDALNKILSSSDEGRKRLAQLKSPLFKRFLPIMEKLLMPGITLHYILRKLYIEDYALKCIEDGVTQVINLGAGLDSLCYRLSNRFENVNFIEIDHPATSRLKVEAFKNEPNMDKNLALVQVDFTQQTLEDRLGSNPRFLSDRPTLFISEGVLMYLTEEQVSHQFRILKEMTKIEPKLIFSYVEPDALKKQTSGILLPLYLKIKEESLDWTIKTNDLGSFVERNGYTLISAKSPAEFKSNYLSDDYKGTIHSAENFAIAEGVG